MGRLLDEASAAVDRRRPRRRMSSSELDGPSSAASCAKLWRPSLRPSTAATQVDPTSVRPDSRARSDTQPAVANDRPGTEQSQSGRSANSASVSVRQEQARAYHATPVGQSASAASPAPRSSRSRRCHGRPDGRPCGPLDNATRFEGTVPIEGSRSLGSRHHHR